MCDEGRYGFKHVHSPRRVLQLRRREESGDQQLDWSELPAELDARLRQAGHLAAVLSPHLTVEEAYLLCQYLRGLDAQALLALGPVPVDGRGRDAFPTASRSAPKNVRIAAASRRSWRA